MSTPQDEAVTKYLVMQAFASGRYIESKGKQSTNWQEDHFPSWNWEEYDYRVKAEEKWRAFTDTAEVPVQPILIRNSKQWTTILGIWSGGFLIAAETCIVKNTFDQCFDAGDEISLDGGKTWQPCGVKVT